MPGVAAPPTPPMPWSWSDSSAYLPASAILRPITCARCGGALAGRRAGSRGAGRCAGGAAGDTGGTRRMLLHQSIERQINHIAALVDVHHHLAAVLQHLLHRFDIETLARDVGSLCNFSLPLAFPAACTSPRPHHAPLVGTGAPHLALGLPSRLVEDANAY